MEEEGEKERERERRGRETAEEREEGEERRGGFLSMETITNREKDQAYKRDKVT